MGDIRLRVCQRCITIPTGPLRYVESYPGGHAVMLRWCDTCIRSSPGPFTVRSPE